MKMLFNKPSWASLALTAVCVSFTSASIITKRCKATPDSSSWPSTSEWNALNQTVAGRLLKPPPPCAVCHANQPTYDSKTCKSTNWTDAATYANDPLGIINPNWSNDSCLPQPQYPCSGKGFPIYVRDANIMKLQVCRGKLYAERLM